MNTLSARRSAPVDAAKTVAIVGTLLIHASANGGFSWPVGSVPWTANLFWSSVLRCAVPLFFMCSGALLLAPEKEVTLRRVWGHYIPRILLALFFWAAAYAAWSLLLEWRRAGAPDPAAIGRAVVDLLLFRHKTHLYYLHIIVLVYAVLPLTRLLAAKADGKLLAYALGLWFALGCLLPAARAFPPLSLIGGIPTQYALNLTWGAVGYTLLGHVLHQQGDKFAPGLFAGAFFLGLALTFGGTLGLSLWRGKLYLGLLQGFAPGVCLQAAGLFGLCVCRCRAPRRWMETVSQASFCVYLVHLFFLEFLVRHGLSAGVLHPLWAVPALTAVSLGLSMLVWLVLRRVPWVNRHLM